MFDDLESFGGDFNIVKMVEDHVPLRLKNIDVEVTNLQRQINALHSERAKLVALLASLDDTITFEIAE